MGNKEIECDIVLAIIGRAKKFFISFCRDICYVMPVFKILFVALYIAFHIRNVH